MKTRKIKENSIKMFYLNQKKISKPPYMSHSISLFKRAQSAKEIKLKNKVNQYSQYNLTNDKNKIKKNNIQNNNNTSLLNKDKDNKNNKQNQADLIFENPVLYNYYYKNNTRANNYYISLNKIYNPYKSNYKIVKNKKNIIRAFSSQTKNNFNNKYKIIYSNPDVQKRNYVLQCFDSIRKNKTKNINNKNSVIRILLKELNKNNKIMSQENMKVNNNKNFCFSDSFNMKIFRHKAHNIKLKTMKSMDDITYKNCPSNNIEKTRDKRIHSVLFKNKSHENIFFRTLQKNVIKRNFDFGGLRPENSKNNQK